MDRQFLLVTVPDSKVVFQAPDFITSESKTVLKITNKSDSRQAYKVKTTRNELFRIRPTSGILDFSASVDVTISFKPLGNGVEPESDRSHIGVYHIPAPEGATCAAAWAEHYGPAQGEKRLKIFFEKTS